MKNIILVLSLVFMLGCSFGVIGLNGVKDSSVISRYIDDNKLARIIVGDWVFKQHIILDTYRVNEISFFNHTRYVYAKSTLLGESTYYQFKVRIENNVIYFDNKYFDTIVEYSEFCIITKNYIINKI